MGYQAIVGILKLGRLGKITLKSSYFNDEKSAMQGSWDENRS